MYVPNVLAEALINPTNPKVSSAFHIIELRVYTATEKLQQMTATVETFRKRSLDHPSVLRNKLTEKNREVDCPLQHARGTKE